MISDFLFYILLLIPLTVGINYFLKSANRPFFLLIVSVIIIGLVALQALIILLISATLNYLLSKKVRDSKSIFYIALLFNIALIVLSNYIINYGGGLEWELIDFSFKPVLITMGASFYSIQHIAYIIDLRRGAEPISNFFHFLFGSVYFPKFPAGPVTKHSLLTSQIGSKVLGENLIRGFNLLLLGLFKKIVIADRLFTHVHSVFDFDSNYPGLTMFLGSLIFTVQLYFDFSGYSDMALGLSEMMGFKLPDNFNLPFRSLSVGEFWRRWHISLITFFTEYIYNPLAFLLREYRYLSAAAGIFVTFLISGLWHGIGISFLLWCLCHMIALQFELFTKKARSKISVFLIRAFGWVLTMTLVIISNYFFRSNGADLLEKFCSAGANFFPGDFISETLAPLAVGGHQVNYFNLYLSLVIAGLFLIFEKRINALSRRSNFSVIYTTVICFLILLLGVFADTEQFIYVQF